MKKNILLIMILCLFFGVADTMAGTAIKDVKLFAHRGLTIDYPDVLQKYLKELEK